ncbi:50S ribosomal protein L28 [Candidatus Hydrogenosomobacter endosymbioticus]|uniref:Large ribosomal subunit protein bL28 n=1 Tax=Candidatus Hydrogenosomobacter endosymbioticus TaxID=2558174 RepID=A0ABM7V8M1_9PROT|nr:50S ribosomal protein L28 [Candidatus Hydrogenosomobacter endosymbioticus]BDB96138.1 50S ribosomal protein L28 [Candidatus Hydrogenosomobacter endosymbioticus]
MGKCCPVLSKKKVFGNNVSHAHNKTRRTFTPNFHKFTFRSDAMNTDVRLLLSQKGRKTIEKYGGIDQFLKSAPRRQLGGPLMKLKKRLLSSIVEQ